MACESWPRSMKASDWRLAIWPIYGPGKQGRGNQPPYRRYGPDTEIQCRPQKPHGPAKPSRILSKTEADTEFQYRPHIVDTDMIADAVFADAISETSIQYAIHSCGLAFQRVVLSLFGRRLLFVFCGAKGVLAKLLALVGASISAIKFVVA